MRRTIGDAKMKNAIEITDDLMHVIDENGYGYDAHILVDHAAARRQIETWAAAYEFDVADASRQIDEYFSQR